MSREDPRERQALRIIEIIEADLEAGKSVIPPWRKTWKGERLLPRNAISNRPYRGGNLLMLAMAPYELPHFLTFNKVVEHGGIVRKGETGWPVNYWKFGDKKSDDEQDEKAKSFRRMFCVGYTVF